MGLVLPSGILSKVRAFELAYRKFSDANPAAIEVIADRLAVAAEEKRQLTYFELAEGLTLVDPRTCVERRVVAHAGVLRSEDRDLLDGLVKYLSFHSYQGARLIAAVLVVEAKGAADMRLFRSVAAELGHYVARDAVERKVGYAKALAKVYGYFEKRREERNLHALSPSAIPTLPAARAGFALCISRP